MLPLTKTADRVLYRRNNECRVNGFSLKTQMCSVR
jgi:hypothetical protein